MIILRNRKSKSFSALDNITTTQDPNNQLTSRDLAIENMKMQRQLMINQRMRQKLQAQERADQLRQISRAQRDEDNRDEQDTKNQIKIQKIEQENSNSEAKNVPLYKTRSKPVQPVPMKT
jgi:hypothetical protein